jgi:hypothetical protein
MCRILSLYFVPFKYTHIHTKFLVCYPFFILFCPWVCSSTAVDIILFVGHCCYYLLFSFCYLVFAIAIAVGSMLYSCCRSQSLLSLTHTLTQTHTWIPVALPIFLCSIFFLLLLAQLGARSVCLCLIRVCEFYPCLCPCLSK